ncbi:MAG: calcium-binding protein [Elainellaceae cyanobacterium]
MARIVGGNGNNTLIGRSGNDQIYGLAGNDRLYGRDGNDYLNGGSGNDYMNGGFGNDTYIVNSSGDVATEVAGGIDRVVSSVSHTLSTNLENLTLTGFAIRGTGNSKNNVIQGNSRNNRLYGNAGNDSLRGSSGNDYLNGGSGHDRMYGGSGNDYLTGGSGNDVLVGGTGKDTLVDGNGLDTFKYYSTSESRAGFTRRDVITDFDRGFDKIDLSSIDANKNLLGNQAFNFIGTRGFTGMAGEVRVDRIGSSSIVQVDVHGDGNKLAEMEIQLNNTSFITASDFVL